MDQQTGIDIVTGNSAFDVTVKNVPVVVGVMTWLGFPVEQWVQAGAFVWIVIQAAFYLRSKYRDWKRGEL